MQPVQGTSLPKSVADDLDDMLEHAALTTAARTIKLHYRSSRKSGHSSQSAKLKRAVQRYDVMPQSQQLRIC